MIPAFEALLVEASALFHVTPQLIVGRRKTKTVCAARRWAMQQARARFGWSLPEVGRAFGGRDHTTVLHACQSDEWREVKSFRRKVKRCA